jgi:hypothetical protein
LDCRVESNALHIELESALDCGNELVEVERKKDLLEKAFKRRLLAKVPKKKGKDA